jgi:hypothetical protein
MAAAGLLRNGRGEPGPNVEGQRHDSVSNLVFSTGATETVLLWFPPRT